MYAENGFDINEKAIGINLYLIARTVCSFMSACSEVQRNIPICIGFHDQDQLYEQAEIKYLCLFFISFKSSNKTLHIIRIPPIKSYYLMSHLIRANQEMIQQ